MKEELIKQLKDHEGIRLKPYKCTAGKLTIGIGRNLDDIGISEEEAEYLLGNDIETAHKGCERLISNFESISEVRKIALIDMMFNLGYTRMSKFKKMLSAIESEDWTEAAKQAKDSRWYNQVGRRAQKICDQLREG